MSYNPADIGYTPSFIITGVDTRKYFGVQATSISGRHKISVDQKVITLPQKHGQTVQGGRLSPQQLTISGWMDKNKVLQFRSFLFLDNTVTNKFQKRARYIQFTDEPNTVYYFNSITDFSTEPMTKQWFSNNFIAFNLTITINEGVSYSKIDSSKFSDSRFAMGTFEAAATNPEFLLLDDGTGFNSLRALMHRDYNIRLGFASNPRLVSAETGVILDFNNTSLNCKNTKGVDISAQMFAPTNLLTNGSFESGTTGSPWAGAADSGSGSNSVTGNVEIDTAVYLRPLNGTACLKVASSGSYVGLEQSFTLTSGVDYNVVCECIVKTGSTAFLRIYNPSNSVVYEKTITSSLQWRPIQFSFRALASGSYKVRIGCVGSSQTAYFNRVVIAKSMLSNSSFENTTLSGWTISGASITQTKDSSTFRTGTASMKLVFNGAQSDVAIGTLSGIQPDKLYHVTGYCMRTSGTRDLVISSDGSSSLDAADLLSYHKLITNQWCRFSTFFYSKSVSGTTFKLQSSNAVGSCTMYFDDLAVIECSPRTSGVYYENSVNGKMIQIPLGEALKITDYTNRSGNSIICKFKPLITEIGMTSTIYRVSSNIYNQINLSLNITNNTTASMYGLVAQDYDATYLLATGADNFNISDLGSNGDGLVYCGTRLSLNTYNGTTNDFSIFYPRIGLDSVDIVRDVTREASVSPAYSGKANYDTIIIGDVGAISAFYIYQYDMSDQAIIASICNEGAPVFRNKVFNYTGTILNGDELIIDTEKFTVEMITASSDLNKSNAINNMTGEMLEFFGEKAVLFSDTNIRSINISGKMVQ